ncbi:MAG TPA: hypothetical protein ENN21_00605 [Spirochaetes bacterium]|nr:hypothetical protein [Spirochaetota bacterium]
MKNPSKKGRIGDDDSLFGLLSSYKSHVTYLSLYRSESDDAILLLITDNPGRWSVMEKEHYSGFRAMKRLEIGVNRLSVKYLLPEHLIKTSGPMLGMKLPPNRVVIVNNIDNEGYFILRAPLKFAGEFIQYVRKTIGMSPQKKYEVLEKCLSEIT